MKYKAILHDFFFSLAFTAVVWMFFTAIEESPIGDAVRWKTFEILESTSFFSRQVSDPKIIIINIAGLSTVTPEADASATAASDRLTPREPLRRILGKLACLPDTHFQADDVPPCKGRERPPSVIGIDIDFSPQPDAGSKTQMNFVDQEGDPDFFKLCQSLNTPVFLGVSRTVGQPYDFWLGLPQYKQLAAALTLEEKPKEALTTLGEAPSFASAIASASMPRSADPPDNRWRRIRGLFVDQESETEEVGVRHTVIDYSAINAFKIVPYKCVTEMSGCIDGKPEFAGKIVLIGDVHHSTPRLSETKSDDIFTVPRHEGTVGGVEVHAAAIYTLINPKARFWTFTPIVDFVVDLIFAGEITLLIAWRRYREGDARSKPYYESTFCLAALFVAIGGVVLSPVFMWDGCFIVTISLLIHPVLLKKAEELWTTWRHHVI